MYKIRTTQNQSIGVYLFVGTSQLHRSSKFNLPTSYFWHLRAFSVAGRTVWNSLSDSLRDPDVESERNGRDFKAHLFAVGY